MSNEEAIAIIKNEYKCVDRDCDIERSCGKCDLMMPNKEPILEAYKLAIKALSQEPIKYWIDHNGHVIPIQQPCDTENCKIVKALIGDPCKVKEPCDDAISRKTLLTNLYQYKISCAGRIQAAILEVEELVEKMPSVTHKSGKWLERQNVVRDLKTNNDYLRWKYECSECGYEARSNYHFCPNCGAKMQESEEQE